MTRPGCKPWCVSHEAGMCTGPNLPAYPGVGVSHTPGSGVTLHINGPADLPLPEAQAFMEAYASQLGTAGSDLATGPGCPPWCAEHYDEDELCEASAIPAAAGGEICMSREPDGRVRVSLYGQHDWGLSEDASWSVAEAEQVAHAILAMTARTRAAAEAVAA